jgi:hypothetical protein
MEDSLSICIILHALIDLIIIFGLRSIFKAIELRSSIIDSENAMLRDKVEQMRLKQEMMNELLLSINFGLIGGRRQEAPQIEVIPRKKPGPKPKPKDGGF